MNYNTDWTESINSTLRECLARIGHTHTLFLFQVFVVSITFTVIKHHIIKRQMCLKLTSIQKGLLFE